MAKRGRPPLYGKSLEEIFHETGASRSAYRRHRKAGKSHDESLALAIPRLRLPSEGADVPSVPEPDLTGAIKSVLRRIVSQGLPVDEAVSRAKAAVVADMPEPDTGNWGPAG